LAPSGHTPIPGKTSQVGRFLQIHFFGHMFFDDGLERFRGKPVRAMGFHKVMHHIHEALVPIDALCGYVVAASSTATYLVHMLPWNKLVPGRLAASSAK